MESLLIRKASPEDAKTIAEFQVAMALESENLKLNPEVVDQGVRGVFENLSRGIYFVATPLGNPTKVIASLLITYEWSDWRNGTVWWIQSVYVRPDWRRQGVYKKMYSHLQKLVQESPDLKGLRLYVDKTNTRAQRVYENLGMNLGHYLTGEWLKPQ